MRDLKETDTEAWYHLEAPRQDAADFGLDLQENREHPDGNPRGSYRCPMGRNAFGGLITSSGALPRLGELDVDGTVPVNGSDVHWRYYFMEPRHDGAIEGDVLLGCSVRSKGIGSAYRARDQTRHMRDAIEAGNAGAGKVNHHMRGGTLCGTVEADL